MQCIGNSIHCNKSNTLVALLQIYSVGIYKYTVNNFSLNLSFISATYNYMNTTRHNINM